MCVIIYTLYLNIFTYTHDYISFLHLAHTTKTPLAIQRILEARRCVRRRHYHLTVASVTGAANLGPRWNTGWSPQKVALFGRNMFLFFGK